MSMLLARFRSLLPRWPHHLPRPTSHPHEPLDFDRGSQQHFGVMFALDIADFSSRPAFIQQRLRAVLYQLVEDADVRSRRCIREDRGDGMFVINATETNFAIIVNRVAPRLAAGLNAYNRTARPGASLDMRMAVHVGYFQPDKHGVISPDLILTFRLLDAPQLKQHLADSTDHLALIISDHVYGVGVSFQHLDPDDYRSVSVTSKGMTYPAWIRKTQP
ncbi:hypothetical protein [Spirillospora sp. CA-294931]|uniref:hypothetical protein n=1 Tax=Spirillospora sp. CA-294931 TaxID=3240042 RepID=UPI003D8FC4F1